MTDSIQGGGPAGAGVPMPPDAAGVGFEIKKIYTKDASLEVPHAPEIFLADWQPATDMNVLNEVTRLSDSEFEVMLRITVEATLGERNAFLAEVSLAGLFTVVGVTDAERDEILGAVCPGILFPYARETLSDLSIRAGFPQYILAPVNFQALYHQRRMEAAEKSADASAE